MKFELYTLSYGHKPEKKIFSDRLTKNTHLTALIHQIFFLNRGTLYNMIHLRSVKIVSFYCMILLLLAGLTACGKTTYGVAKIESIPSGAEVVDLKDDAHLGRTPLYVTWEGDEDSIRHATIELRKEGYMEKITAFWVKMRHDTKEDAIEDAQPVVVELKKRK